MMITVDGFRSKTEPNRIPFPVEEECLDRLQRLSAEGGHAQVVRFAKDPSVSGANFAAGDIVYVVSPTRTVYMVVDTHMRFTNLKGLHKASGSDAFYDATISTDFETVVKYLSRFYTGNVRTGQVDLIGLSPQVGLAPIRDPSTGHRKLAAANYPCPFAHDAQRNNKHWRETASRCPRHRHEPTARRRPGRRRPAAADVRPRPRC